MEPGVATMRPEAGDAADEIRAQAADDPRQRCRGPSPAYRVVQGVPASGRAGPGREGAQYGADTSVLDWRDRLVCSKCGGRQVDMVVTGTGRR